MIVLQATRGMSLPGEVRLVEGQQVRSEDLDPTLVSRLVSRGLLQPVEMPDPEPPQPRQAPKSASPSTSPRKRSRRGTAAHSKES